MTHAEPPLVVVMGAAEVEPGAVASTVASRLGVPFLDADDLRARGSSEQIASQAVMTDPEHGPWLRVVVDWLRAHRSTGGVLATSPLGRQSRAHLLCRPHVRFIHLVSSDELVDRRIPARNHVAPAEFAGLPSPTVEPLGLDEPGYSMAMTNDPPDVLVTKIVHRLTQDRPAGIQDSIRDGRRLVMAHRAVLFRAEATSGHCGVIESGLVKCTARTGGAKDTVWLVGPGEFVGEHRLLGRPATYTATALGVPVLKPWQENSWTNPLATEDWATAALVNRIDEAMRQRRDRSETVPVRLRSLLQLLAQHLGRRVDGNIHCCHGLTQDEMASILGTERVTVNRALAAFTRAQWMTSEHGAFTVLDESGFELST